MKTRVLLLALTLACASRAGAATTVFTDPAAFAAALSGPQTTLNFDSAPLGGITGSEFAAQGFTFSSPAGLAMEVAPPSSFAVSNYLNVGERPFQCCSDNNNDSLDITITGDWSALAFSFIDGAVPGNASESITFYGNSGNVLYTRAPGDSATSFIGIVSDQPIRRALVIEAANDGDDMGYDNFVLGNAVLSAVPEPEMYAMFIAGLALLGFAAKRRKTV
jgi:hypothetical protein